MDYSPLSNLAYLVAAMLFIVGLKLLSRPSTAVLGNGLAALGMAVAIGGALIGRSNSGYIYILVGLVVGSAIGAVLAYTIKLTAAPKMMALFNGFGGGASVLVAGAVLLQRPAVDFSTDVVIAEALSGILGAISFWGSLVVYARLEEFSSLKNPFTPQVQRGLSIGLAALAILFSLLMTLVVPSYPYWGLSFYIVIMLLISVLTIVYTGPIGGADLPVVIALLHAASGLAAAATGFVLENHVLIIGGSLVGASGILLSRFLCREIDRSLLKVLLGRAEPGASKEANDELYANVRSTTADDVARLLKDARRVVIVPGYGLAVAQAQHAVRDLARLLEDRGATVEYAIHPLAGRMPGHMGMLLAEADIDFEKLKESRQINPTLDTVDVVIVISANDVVNPQAHSDEPGPLAGVPIIDVDKCRTVIVIKRSLSPGFAGIPNPLFGLPNTLMLYGDGQNAVLDIVRALKAE